MKLRSVPVILAIAALFSCHRVGYKESSTHYALGTVCAITLFENGSPEAYAALFARISEIEGRMSANLEGSEIDAVNRAAGVEPVTVSQDTFTVVQKALEYAEATDGIFDPTIGPLVKLWGIGTDDARVPDSGEIETAKTSLSWRDVATDPSKRTVHLRRKGMRLDLGGIAKGYAADECARIIRERGIPRAIVNLGGNVYAIGSKKDGKPWRIGLQNPDGDRDSHFAVAKVSDLTLVTSGDYERVMRTPDGKSYHHILDPRTGYPADSGLKAVTVIGPSSMDADAMSTSLFIMGAEAGGRLLDARPGFAAVFVGRDNRVLASDGAGIEITDEAFTMAGR